MHFNHKLIVLIILITIYKINGIEYTCYEESIPRQNYYGTINKCTVLNIKLDAISNFSLRSQSNSRSYIRQLNFSNSTIAYLPRGIFTYITNLNVLNISGCGLREMSRFDFEHGMYLTDLNAAANNLTELRDSIFYGADNLQRIDLSLNRIEKIDSNAFINLKQLIKIDLAANQIKVLPSNLFANLLKLTTIDLSRNLIEVIDSDNIFLNLQLSELNLNSNNIYIIVETALAEVHTIKQLNLNFNRISNITLHDQVNIENLSIISNGLVLLQVNDNVRVVQADHNKLTNHNLRIDDKDTQLTKLSLLNNSLTTIGFIKNLTRLTYLDVSFNTLADDSIASDTFTKLTSLKTLYMESINLKNIDFQLFSEQLNLEILDISYNNLNSINFHMLSFLQNLKQLFINGNNLTNITLSEFGFLFPNLNVIDISDNNWDCDYLIEILKQLKALEVKIYLNGNKIVKNETNIRGIRCTRGNQDLVVTTKTPTIHGQYDLNNNDHMLQLNETQTLLEALRQENINLKTELNDVIQNLDKLTNETEMIRINNDKNNETYEISSNQTIEQLKKDIIDSILNKYVKQMTTQIDQADRKINNIQNDVEALRAELRESEANADKQIESDTKNSGSNNNHDNNTNKSALIDESMNDDVKFIKMGLIAIFLVAFATSIIFVGFKLRRKYFTPPFRRPYSYQSTNTVSTAVEENSI